MNEPLNVIDAALWEAVSITMEDMAFEEVEVIRDREEIDLFEIGNPAENSITEKVVGSLPFTDPLSGDIFIIFDINFARQMSEALHGAGSGNPSEEIIRDTLGEVLNTIGGCFIKKLLPPDQQYKLGFPVIRDGSLSPEKDVATELYLSVGDFCMKAIITGTDFMEYRDEVSDEQEVTQ